MRRDDEAVYTRVVGQGDLDRHRCAARPTPLVEHVSHGLRSEGTAAMGVSERCVELSGAVLVKQAKQAAGSAAQVAAMFSDFSKRRLGRWATGEQSIASAMLAALALVHEQRREV